MKYVVGRKHSIMRLKEVRKVYLTSRQSQILYRLIEQPMTIKELMKWIPVSEKTMRKDLQELAYFLMDYDSELLMDKHIQLKSIYTNRWWLSQIPSMLAYRTEDAIKLFLLIQQETVTIMDLSDEFHYTKSSIERILYGSEFENFPLLKKRNVGIIFDGTDKDRFDLFVTLLVSLGSYSNMPNTIKTVLSHAHIHYDYKQLEFIFESMKQYVEGQTMMDKQVLTFYCLLVGCLVLPCKEKTRTSDPTILEMITVMDLHVLNQQMLEMMVNERAFCHHVTTNQASLLMQQMMTAIEEELLITIHKTPLVESQLEKHIEDALKRFQNYVVQVEGNQRFIQDFRANYPLAYEASTIATRLLQPYSSTLLPDVETIYFGMYFHLLMEQGVSYLDDVHHIAIICEHGFGMRYFIQTTLMERFESFRIRKIASVFELTQQPNQFESYDFIICTLDHVLVEEPILSKLITISPLLTKKDMRMIEEALERSQHLAFMKRLKAHTVFESNMLFSSPTSLIAWASQQLLSRGYVTNKFEASVLEREKKIPTAFDYVAIPHGDFHQVKQSCCVVICLKSPMLWSGQLVEMVMLLAVNDHDLTTKKEAIAQLYQQLANEHAYKDLRNIWGTSEIVTYLMGGN